MIKINVELLWKVEELKVFGVDGIEGVWGTFSFNIVEDTLIEKAEIEDTIRREKWGVWVEFTKQYESVCNKIANWVETKGNFPVGLPACTVLGSPDSIKFIDYEIVGEDENEPA